MNRNPHLRAIVAALSALAAASAGFLLWQSLSGAAIPGCGAGSGCDSVLSSRFSTLGPISVSAVALPIFLMMVICSVSRSDLSHRLLIGLAILASSAAIWFIAIQALVIHRFCTYCTITHALALAASGLVFLEWARSGIRVGPVIPAAAALLVAAMIGTQLLFQPRLYTITTTTQPATQPSAEPNQLVLYNNRISINPDEWPAFGSRRAQHRALLLFDYTCSHCRREYPLLQQARARYGTQIAFIAMPLPLEPSCNPAIPRVIPEHVNSCTYTRYALAVFIANPARFEEFHNRIMEGERPPSLEETRRIAEELITAKAFAAALADPSIEQHIRQSVQIYRDLGGREIPKLVLPAATIHGEIHPLQHLFDVLESHLDVKPLR